MRRVALTCHPSSPSEVVRGLEVRLSVAADGTLLLGYVLEADTSRIRIPPSAAPRRTDGLWRHTCFEAFVKTGESQGYREFNFAPSTEWAAYFYGGYRADMTLIEEEECRPRIITRLADHRLELDATVRIPRPAHLGLSAVIEEDDGRLSYWALRHPAAKPDFHHPESFALES